MASVMQEQDSKRRIAAQVAEKAAELAGLVAPLDGLGVALTEAGTRLYGAISHGTPIAPPSFMLTNAWAAAGWNVPEILGMLEMIYDNAIPAYEALAAEARS